MNNKEKEKFWQVLLNMHDSEQRNLEKLRDSIKRPRYLCRFRAVNEHTLNQLQENKLYYSTSVFYDDPFDTYFYINHRKIEEFYVQLRIMLEEKNPLIMGLLKELNLLGAPNEDELKNLLLNTSLNFDALKTGMDFNRKLIQKGLHTICFSEDENNEELWLKYADNYKGFVLIYDFDNPETEICGKEDICKACSTFYDKPTIYPIYYADERYDATRYAMGLFLLDMAKRGMINLPNSLIQVINNSIIWEAERVSLIKKKCHEYDKEWRMIRPAISDQRSNIKLKPSKIILGMKMPNYERRLAVSAASIAGIKEISELFINEDDELDNKPFII